MTKSFQSQAVRLEWGGLGRSGGGGGGRGERFEPVTFYIIPDRPKSLHCNYPQQCDLA